MGCFRLIGRMWTGEHYNPPGNFPLLRQATTAYTMVYTQCLCRIGAWGQAAVVPVGSGAVSLVPPGYGQDGEPSPVISQSPRPRSCHSLGDSSTAYTVQWAKVMGQGRLALRVCCPGAGRSPESTDNPGQRLSLRIRVFRQPFVPV